MKSILATFMLLVIASVSFGQVPGFQMQPQPNFPRPMPTVFPPNTFRPGPVFVPVYPRPYYGYTYNYSFYYRYNYNYVPYGYGYPYYNPRFNPFWN